MSPNPDRERSQRHLGPLAGLRVIELSIYVQGPVAGVILHGLGADVIKLERADQPDQTRSWAKFHGLDLTGDDGKDWLFGVLNRGKRSLALSIDAPQAIEPFHDLVRTADLFLTNLRPSALEARGADFATLSAINPRLVYARGAGFGLHGELANVPCQDTIGMAYGGVAAALSATDEPYYPSGAWSDILTGTNLASAALAGLLGAQRDGRGRLVGTSQVQSLMWLQMFGVAATTQFDVSLPKHDVAAPNNPLMNFYRSSTGWIAIAVIDERRWRVALELIGLADMAADATYATFLPDEEHRRVLTAAIAEHVSSKPTTHWIDVFRHAGIWASPVNSVADLIGDTNVAANQLLTSHADGVVTAALPIEVDGRNANQGSVAQHGEHSDVILAELGLSAHEIEQLRLAGALW